MIYRIAADLVLVLHLAFIVFVVFGGLLVLKYRWVLYAHIPAAVWGAYVEIAGHLCPLTTWENDFLRRAGEAGYSNSFVEHYVLPVIYPAGLTRTVQFWLAGFVVLANIVIYGWLLYRGHKVRQAGSVQ